jgi:[glutamine synthetase] adenylyltransferase / [glutamine synthetase]-adenylyl-L-tyrosine phosphorylase
VRGLPTRGRAQLDQLMPSLMEAAAQADDPDVTLERLLRLLTAVVRRTAYLDLLVENPLALSQLVRLVGESSWVVSQLILPAAAARRAARPAQAVLAAARRSLRGELANLLQPVADGDLEQEMERLRQFAQGNRLRVAAADIVGAIPLMVVSDYLTEIAEVTLQRVLVSAWRDLASAMVGPGDRGRWHRLRGDRLRQARRHRARLRLRSRPGVPARQPRPQRRTDGRRRWPTRPSMPAWASA